MKRVLCVDGNSILNRAFYGIRPLTTKDGQPTNAIYGFVNILSRQLTQLQPDYLVCAFDLKVPTFRHQAYAEYKAGRHETPPELLAQFSLAKDCARALGFRVAELPGYEADDILGTCARLGEESGCEVYLLTGDKDALQLISSTTTVLLATNHDNIPYTPEKFREVYGINPAQFVDVKALMGDSSDNIPGVRGIGEKTALKLIAAFANLDGLFAALDDPTIAKGVREKLMLGADSARFSKFLATIVTDAPLDFALSGAENPGLDKAALRALFVRLEFSKFMKTFDLEGLGDETADTAKTADDSPNSPLPEAEASSQIPTHPPLPMRIGSKADVLALPGSLAFVFTDETHTSGCFSNGEEVVQVELDAQLTIVTALLDRLIVYDSKALYHTLHLAGSVPEQDVFFDCMLAAYCLCPTEKYEFSRLVLQYLHRTDGDTAAACEKASMLFDLQLVFRDRLDQTEMTELYETIEKPLSRVLYDMETVGFRVDTQGLAAFGAKLGELCDMYTERIYFAAQHSFNINSPKQLGEVLFDEMQIPSPTKKRSTNAEVLEKLRPYYPIVADILEYRQVMKLKSTYADGLCKVAGADGRIHSTFHQTVTATGRLSSTEPNLQNIPIRTEMGRELRRFFITKNDDYVLVDADYSQIELRLLAAISGDQNMTNAFLSSADIHTMTAAQVFGVAPDDVTPQLRKRAKAVNFGIVYGIGDFSLAGDIGVSKKEAAAFIASYLASYPGIAAFLKNVVEQARKCGYSKTIFGRRRPIPELFATKKMLVAFGERVAMNSPIQGSAADIIKLAMIHLHQRLRDSGLDARLILQVHDELILECRRDQVQAVRDLLVDVMEHTVSLTVPLTVDVQSGDNWFDGH